MTKPISRTINLHITHLENALAQYLKSYFPEQLTICGIDITYPVSRKDNTADVTVFFDNVASDKIPTPKINEVKKEQTNAKSKVRKPRSKPVDLVSGVG